MSYRPCAVPAVKIDNARLRVTEWRLPPGGATGWHRHELDYCVMPMTTGKLRAEGHDGVHDAELISGQPYFREARRRARCR